MSSSRTSSVPKRLVCLLCEGRERDEVDCSLRHIHAHLTYKKYACESCEFSCYTEDEGMVHKFRFNHAVTHNRNEYKEMVSNRIYLDCLHAAEFGLAAVLKDSQLNKTPSFSTQYDPDSTQDRVAVERESGKHKAVEGSVEGGSSKENKKHLDAPSGGRKQKSSRDTPNFSFAFDESRGSGGQKDDNERCTRREKSKKNDSKDEGDVRPGPSKNNADGYSIVEQRNSLLKSQEQTIKCMKCKQMVDASYVQRRHHVMATHLRLPAEQVNDQIASVEMRECFPTCSVYSDQQCIECGRVVKSDNGRRSHVSSNHFEKSMICVVPGCGEYEANPSDLKRHIECKHGVPLLSSVISDTFRLYLCAKKEYDAALAIQILHCFPFEPRQTKSAVSLNDFSGVRGIPSATAAERFSSVRTAIHDELGFQGVKPPRRERTPSPESSDSSGDSLQFILRKRKSSEKSLDEDRNNSLSSRVQTRNNQPNVSSTNQSSGRSDVTNVVGAVSSKQYEATGKQPSVTSSVTTEVEIAQATTTMPTIAGSSMDQGFGASSRPISSCFATSSSSDLRHLEDHNFSVDDPKAIWSMSSRSRRRAAAPHQPPHRSSSQHPTQQRHPDSSHQPLSRREIRTLTELSRKGLLPNPEGMPQKMSSKNQQSQRRHSEQNGHSRSKPPRKHQTHQHHHSTQRSSKQKDPPKKEPAKKQGHLQQQSLEQQKPPRQETLPQQDSYKPPTQHGLPGVQVPKRQEQIQHSQTLPPQQGLSQQAVPHQQNASMPQLPPHPQPLAEQQESAAEQGTPQQQTPTQHGSRKRTISRHQRFDDDSPEFTPSEKELQQHWNTFYSRQDARPPDSQQVPDSQRRDQVAQGSLQQPQNGIAAQEVPEESLWQQSRSSSTTWQQRPRSQSRRPYGFRGARGRGRGRFLSDDSRHFGNRGPGFEDYSGNAGFPNFNTFTDGGNRAVESGNRAGDPGLQYRSGTSNAGSSLQDSTVRNGPDDGTNWSGRSPKIEQRNSFEGAAVDIRYPGGNYQSDNAPRGACSPDFISPRSNTSGDGSKKRATENVTPRSQKLESSRWSGKRKRFNSGSPGADEGTKMDLHDVNSLKFKFDDIKKEPL